MISLAMLNLLDFETTFILMQRGVEEANPILNYLITATGTPWVILWVKVIVLMLLFAPYAFWLKYRERCQKTDMAITLGVLNLYYSAVVILNLNLVML